MNYFYLRVKAVALLSIFLFIATAVTADAQTSSLTLDSEQAAFLTLINNYRQQNGVGPLQVSVTLQNSSQWMSVDMATKNYFSHTDSLGRDPFVRMAAFGYPTSTEGENIAAGNGDAQNTFNQFLTACDPDSSGNCTYGHRENMRNGAYKVMGIGRYYSGSSTYRWYWSTDFGSTVDQLLSSGSTSSPPPSSCTSAVSGDHWKGEYFNNPTLAGTPLMVRDDGIGALNFNWGNQGSPSSACNLPGVSFSARWTRAVSFTAGTYRFFTSSDDGMRLYIDGQKVQDRWYDQAASQQTVDVTLTGGTHTVVVEYYQAYGADSVAVSWQQLTTAANTCTVTVASDHWKGEYFNNTTLSGTPLMVRDDGTDVLNLNWGNQGSPSTACNLPGVLFSARWTRLVSFTAGTYRFFTSSDDGMRLYIDGQKVQDRWYDQAAGQQTVDVTLAGGTHTVLVEYYQAYGSASAAVSWQQLTTVANTCTATVASDHWKGEYFNNTSLSGTPLMVRDDGTDVLNFNWGNQGSPNTACNLPGTVFSIRWTRANNFAAGTYRFFTSSDDGMRLYIDGQKVQDRWFDQSATPQTVDVTLTAGNHTLVLEYYQAYGNASAALSWQQLNSVGTTCMATVAGDHWKGEYFNNMTLTGTPIMVRDDGTSTLNFDWGYQGSPSAACNVPGVSFSVRWTRSVTFNSGTYRFSTSTDDGMRLYIDGQRVQDRWFYQTASVQTVDVTLTGGTHTVVVEYFQAGGQDSAAVSWQQL